MTIPVECPACEHRFSIPAEYGGKKGKCPECDKVFVAPTAEAAHPPERTKSIESAALDIPKPSQVTDRRPPVPPPEDVSQSEVPPVVGPVLETEVTPASSAVIHPNSDTASSVAQRSSRRRSNTPKWIAVTVLGVAVIAVCITVILVTAGGKDDPASSDNSPNKTPPKQQSDPKADGKKTPTAATLSEAELADMWQAARPAVFTLTSERPGGNFVGMGFLIDDRGWIATTYQQVRDAHQIHALPIDGGDDSALEVAGTIAISEDEDIAILALDKPLSVEPLKPRLAELLKDQLLAVCNQPVGGATELLTSHVRGTTDIESLSPNSRAVARNLGLDRQPGITWIEHTLTTTSVIPGAPVLDEEGRVAGVTEQFSPTSRVAYAIPISRIEFLKESADGSVTKLPGKVVATGPKPMTPEHSTNTGPMGEPMNGTDPKDPPRGRPDPGSLESVDVINELSEQAEKQAWGAETVDEYEVLRDLAEYIHVGKKNENDVDIEEGIRVLVATAAQRVLEELSTTAWPANDEISRFNELAIAGLKSPGKGVFAYVQIQRDATETTPLDGTPTIVCNLIGTDTLIVLPVKETSPLLKKGSRWLVMGVHEPENDFAIRDKAADDIERVAYLIRAMNLLGEPK